MQVSTFAGVALPEKENRPTVSGQATKKIKTHASSVRIIAAVVAGGKHE